MPDQLKRKDLESLIKHKTSPITHKLKIDKCPFCDPLRFKEPSSGQSWLGPNGENLHLETRPDNSSVYITCREAGWKLKTNKHVLSVSYCPACGRDLIETVVLNELMRGFIDAIKQQ